MNSTSEIYPIKDRKLYRVCQKIVRGLIETNIETREDLNKIKRKIAGEDKLPPPSNVILLSVYRKLIGKKKIKRNEFLEGLLRKREIRTLSGVAVVAVLTRPSFCPGECIYCPKEKDIPKSYLSNEPAVMRAILANFDPFRQVQMRLRSLTRTGHETSKIELIVMGGTWSVLPKRYQRWFITRCFAACNTEGRRVVHGKTRRIKSLKEEQRINEKAKHRIVGLTLETRPDFINIKEIKRMRSLGATRVELGVQTIDDEILKNVKRGHFQEETIQATKLLKDAGFKVSYHMMPNLPGATPKKDFEVFEELFSLSSFRPDMLKIYPCLVIKGSELYKWWKSGRYRAYSKKELLELLIKIKSIIPPYVRISRLIRDVPAPSIEEGNKISNLREVVQTEMEKRGVRCRCIRCREVKNLKFKIENLKFVSREYEASEGREYFLSYEDVKGDKIIAFLRLRIPSQIFNKGQYFISELEGAAIIRELHTCGKAVPLKKKIKGASQHLGFGKKLMNKAEKIVKGLGIGKMAVISGVGVREYYRHLGYRREGDYMIKVLA
ncbi:MAG: tRNA uridine(34) 5-carboxymethylaminomethyl modification radical SAM/GNAT enzyme Elp3 [Parcubacteria group bacterium CG_4_10_14_0_8_um_filter_35_7]|nr:MAG: tRNA uridine(34) 5-carboxymethylaminomethyl modification radical SAM/GNAT enzyme Elp3 [Parcubacteria group bacterium CG_4_10_14_0_8_um_filter_35_7]